MNINEISTEVIQHHTKDNKRCMNSQCKSLIINDFYRKIINLLRKHKKDIATIKVFYTATTKKMMEINEFNGT